jgi:hypothetical protein
LYSKVLFFVAIMFLAITSWIPILNPLCIVFLIIIGKPGGCIERSFSATFPAGCVYSVQENAWMDEHLVLEWVRLVLHPWAENAPHGVRPLLLLDRYRCHTMPSVQNAIAACGVDLRHIPAGCTGETQPTDIGINKPFKNRVRQRWEAWMVEEGLAAAGRLREPSRQQMSSWINETLNSLEVGIVMNAWRRSENPYFPN